MKAALQNRIERLERVTPAADTRPVTRIVVDGEADRAALEAATQAAEASGAMLIIRQIV